MQCIEVLYSIKLHIIYRMCKPKENKDDFTQPPVLDYFAQEIKLIFVT